MSAPASVTVTLPDGKALTFPRGVTGGEIAAAIGPGLAKAALIVMVNGKEYDLFRPIEEDAQVRIVTRKDPEALELIRHDMAHVLAMAVQALYPGTQVTIGPAIEDVELLVVDHIPHENIRIGERSGVASGQVASPMRGPDAFTTAGLHEMLKPSSQ